MLVLFVAFVAPALADEFRPAYLQLKQIDATTYDVLWRVPALDANTTLRLQPVFPDGTQELTERSRSYASNAAVLRWRIRVDGARLEKRSNFHSFRGVVWTCWCDWSAPTAPSNWVGCCRWIRASR